MNCYLCGGERLEAILDMPPVEVFIGGYASPDKDRPRLECRLVQCLDCSHVFQPMTPQMQGILDRIYTSVEAQASTATGVGQWGVTRARKVLERMKLPSVPARVLEIGCPNEYMLSYFRDCGSNTLVGVDPSLPETGTREGITFIKEFFSRDLELKGTYDLVFAVNVLEHVEDVRGILMECRNLLSPEGRLFFVVPNTELQLSKGDPVAFMHEHIHCFTEAALKKTLAACGFRVEDFDSAPDNFYVTAVRGEGQIQDHPQFFHGYHAAVKQVVERFESILSSGRIGVHGAGNALSNLLGWQSLPLDHVVVTDNDPSKYGKFICNAEVRRLNDAELQHLESLLVVPYAYFDEIRADYVTKGFQGPFHRLVD